MNYETNQGDAQEVEVSVDYDDNVVGGDYTDSILDESARRFIIAEVMEEGGRVRKIKRMK